MTERVVDTNLKKDFERLCKKWRNETWYSSSLNKITNNPAYHQIIDIGERVLPLIFEDLYKNKNHWFAALTAITGKDAAFGTKTYEQAVGSWLDWAVAHGYLAPEKRENAMKFYSVDGMSFIIQDGWVEGAGWQDRHLEFPADSINLVIKVIKSAEDNKKHFAIYGERVTHRFKLSEVNNWITIEDDIKLKSFAFSKQDIPALVHILEELKKLQKKNLPRAGHFCDKYGIVDDD